MTIEKWIINPGKCRVIDLELVRKLKVSLIGGKVDVIAHDEPGARIEVTGVTGKGLKVEIDGDVLEIDHPQLRWDNFIDVVQGLRGSAKAEVSILAPRHVVAEARCRLGRGARVGLHDRREAQHRLGRPRARQPRGRLELSSVSGEISAGNHTGRITGHSVSGDIVATRRHRARSTPTRSRAT